MHVEKFKASGLKKLTEEIQMHLPDLTYNHVQKLLRNKDVKVNGVRVKEDIRPAEADLVECYLPDLEKNIDILYEDENLLVCFKPRKMEVESLAGEPDLIIKLEKQVGCHLFAVHRLDRNTMGLVVLAKNNSAKNSLNRAIKAHRLEKFYLAMVSGVMEKPEDDMIAYLFKDSEKSLVKIADQEKAGYQKIETKYKVLSQFDDHALVEVNLVTGKTHQIRAHFAHIGHFVIGDEKYGDTNINKRFKRHYQCLCAYKLIFHFESGDPLSYLDGKVIKIQEKNVEL